jgi:dienelactone hydrolase
LKRLILVSLLAFTTSTLLFAQQPVETKLPAAATILSPALCGKGAFFLSVGEQRLGRETFEITCRSDGGYTASGQTKMDIPGRPLEVQSTLELDKNGLPSKFTMKGIADAKALDQVITLKEGAATITVNGSSREIPYTIIPSILSFNISYTYQFVASRYDAARGGKQEIPLLPDFKIEIERTGRDEVQPAGLTATVKPTAFDRYNFQIAGSNLILWIDMQGRLALLHVPQQNVFTIREGYEQFVAPLRAALLAKTKGLVPDYSAPPGAAFTAEEVSVQAKGLKLGGTLLLPKTGKGPFPAVVTSTGSGQQTRDSPFGIPGLEGYRMFRQIAEALASRGIAVLRVDDRGVGDSTGFETLMSVTTFDFADDVRAQIAYLRTRREIDPKRIAIVGHSEGGLIAPLVAASDKQLAAIVLMAGTAKRGDEVLLYQLNILMASDPKLSASEQAQKRAENEAFIRAIKERGDLSKYPAVLRALGSPWGQTFATYDPLPTIRKVRQPILILQGELDRQVTADQAKMLEEAARAAGNKDVTVRVFPKLNHLFLPSETGAESEYASIKTSALPEDVITALADWLHLKLRAGK